MTQVYLTMATMMALVRDEAEYIGQRTAIHEGWSRCLVHCVFRWRSPAVGTQLGGIGHKLRVSRGYRRWQVRSIVRSSRPPPTMSVAADRK